MSAYRITGPAQLSGDGWTLNGHQIEFDIEMPGPADTSAAANEYRARNIGKVGTCLWFRGVRFATYDRWKQAVMLPLSGDIDATGFGPVPMQGWEVESMGERRPKYGEPEENDWAGHGTFESEFPWTMNIWLPDDGTDRDFLIYQPGGGQGVNWAGGWHHWGDVLAYEQRMNVAAIDYRRGPFGRWYTPGMALEPDWAGPNFGLSDVKAAMTFLETYKTDFGTRKRTIAGTSAGGENTAALAEARSFDGLYDYRLINSGGGGERWRPGPITGGTIGYVREFDRITRAMKAAGAAIPDRRDPTRTVAQAMDAEGDADGMRRAYTAEPVAAAFTGSERYVRGQTQLLYTAHRNYGVMRDGLEITANSATDAAIAGLWANKPTWIMAVENETTSLYNPANVSTNRLNRLAQRLGIASFAEWAELPFVDPAWGREEHARILGAHAVYFRDAWRQAKALRVQGVPAYLSLVNITHGGAGRLAHSGNVQTMFGQSQLEVGGSATTANITERGLRNSHAQRRALGRFVRYGSPSLSAGPVEDRFSPFATPTDYDVRPADATDRWNVIGANARSAEGAPLECRYEDYFAGAWPIYEAKIG